jgi:HD-GYP domain-containing protein (c-di-GMP phosphodiesterase class II)
MGRCPRAPFVPRHNLRPPRGTAGEGPSGPRPLARSDEGAAGVESGERPSCTTNSRPTFGVLILDESRERNGSRSRPRTLLVQPGRLGAYRGRHATEAAKDAGSRSHTTNRWCTFANEAELMKDSRDRDDARHAALRQDSLETERQPGLGTSDLPARFRLADLLAGLSVACDLGFGLPPEEAMRSCLVATALARKLGLAEEVVSDTFYTALLLHVGCTGFAHETAAMFGDELVVLAAVARTNVADPREIVTKVLPAAMRGRGPLAKARTAGYTVVRGQAFGKAFDTGSCEVASRTAQRIGLGEGVQQALYDTGEWWKGGAAPRGIRGEDIALPARIARVAADAVALDDIGEVDEVAEGVRRRGGVTLDPAVVEAFVADAREMLSEASAGDPRERVLDVEPEPVAERRATDLREVAAAFGDIADLKTPFTHGHSGEVARLATQAAERLRLDARTVRSLEVAALLHDVGRAAVSNVVWEKPGPLTRAEWEQVRLHAYHSERILATSRSLEPMAATAGMHHERLDGSGYHRGCRGREATPASRVLATADAFQAMTQARPHRAALPPEQAAAELRREARAGRLDSDAVAAVLDAAGHKRGRRTDLRPGGLSEREIEVVRLVADGCSNPEIAQRLVISRRTAEHHVQNVYAKLGIASRPAVALFALEHDLLAPSSRA